MFPWKPEGRYRCTKCMAIYSAILALNGTSLNSDSALLALNWRYAVEDFFGDQDESFYTTGIQALHHQWKKVCGAQGRLCWEIKPDLVIFVQCIIVSLWTFQPTLVEGKSCSERPYPVNDRPTSLQPCLFRVEHHHPLYMVLHFIVLHFINDIPLHFSLHCNNQYNFLSS